MKRREEEIMMECKRVQLLDCTLRDGGHLNSGKFGKEVIKDVVKKLVASGVDIIEVGFLWEHKCEKDFARYRTIEDVKKILPKECGRSKFSLMADFIDLEHLEPYDETIEYIRLSFKRHRLDWALKSAQILKDKGYKVFINPVNCNVYTDEQYLDVIEKVNELSPYGFGIIDTFGVMRVRDLTYRYSIVEKNLNKDIAIGLHLHENLGLAYSLAQEFVKMVSPKRRVVIDGSLLGMGRIPGNLCIEQMMDHLNNEYGEDYKVEPVFDAIDDYIAPIKKEIPWGYAIPFALSAKYDLHRTYAEFLIEKWKLRTADIERILSMVCKDEAELFNKDYIEQLYRNYISIQFDDESYIRDFVESVKEREILLIASGVSINENQDLIMEYAKKTKAIIICIHCNPDYLRPDLVFFSNIKRFEVFKADISYDRIMITSNLTRYVECSEVKYVIDYSRLANHGDIYCEDSTLMMLNLLKQIGIYSVTIAGFDGLVNGEGKFYIESLTRHDRENNYSDEIKTIIRSYYSDMTIRFLTKSIYEEYKN